MREINQNMNIIIASDFHLKFTPDKESSERMKRVLKFLASLEGKTDILILNGDIFDLWFSWKKVIIKEYFPVYKILADLNESGCRIVFVAGNHDFWFGDFLKKFLNIEIYQNHFAEKIDGKKIFVTHGDLFTRNDIRYKIFRTLVRNKLIMKLFSFLHPDFALRLGEKLSRSSRFRKIPLKLRKIKESGLDNFAEKKLEEYDIVVLGHSHFPKIINFENGIYANCGDWVSHNSYIKINNGKVELCDFEQKTFPRNGDGK